MSKRSKPIPKSRSRQMLSKMVNTYGSEQKAEPKVEVKPDLAELIKMRKQKGNTNGTKLLKGNLKTRKQIHKARIENELPDNVLTQFHTKGTNINTGLFVKRKKPTLNKSQSNLFDNLKDKKIKSTLKHLSFIGRSMNTGKIRKRRISVKNMVKVRKSHINKLERNSKK